MEDLAIKILKQKINERINFINEQAFRRFDTHLDLLSIHLTERQFYVIQKHFNIHKVISIYGVKYDGEISFDNWKCEKIRYNDRQSCFELLIKDIAYIEDDEERFNYLESEI